MKKLIALLAVIGLLWFGNWAQPIAMANPMIMAQTPGVLNEADTKLHSEYGTKVDLNNANVRLFRKYRGFYPTLAKKIVDNAPYSKVEDVLQIAGLSEGQKELLQANLDDFTVTAPADVFNEGGDRYNPGYY